MQFAARVRLPSPAEMAARRYGGAAAGAQPRGPPGRARQPTGGNRGHGAAPSPTAQLTDDDDARLDELELTLRQLTAQARDVVQELGEIKAEIEHINSLDDTADLPFAPASSHLGELTDVVRKLHSNFREQESSLVRGAGEGEPSPEDEHARARLKAIGGVMAHAMLRSVADSRGPPTVAATAAAAASASADNASKQPAKWPRFGQDTITRFERGIPSRGLMEGPAAGLTGRLPQLLSASAELDAAAPAPAPMQAAPTRLLPVEPPTDSGTGQSALDRGPAAARSLSGVTGSPLGWGRGVLPR